MEMARSRWERTWKWTAMSGDIEKEGKSQIFFNNLFIAVDFEDENVHFQ